MMPKKNRPARPDLRPLTARALTSIMDTLRPFLLATDVLDLYSGKGRFGFSALEEGARHVTFVEKNAKSAKELRAQAPEGVIDVICGDVIDFLSRKKEQPFDIVFADPPFRLWEGEYAERLFEAIRPVLSEESIFLVRYPKRVVVSLPIYFECWKDSIFGDSRIQYLRDGESNTNSAHSKTSDIPGDI